MKKLSVVIITLNAERTLEQVLSSASFAHEIIVVDSGSSDNTIEIAKKYQAKIVHQDFLGYGPQKQFAIKLAKHEWVLALDADEVISSELKDFIQNSVLHGDSSYAGYSFPVINVFLGVKLIFWGDAAPQLRLFKRELGNFSNDLVHEKLILNGTSKKVPFPLWHYSYENLTHYLDKFNQYTQKAAEAKFNAGKRSSIVNACLRFKWKFLQLYFLKGGFRFGFAGFSWCLLSAFYPLIKYLKIIELELKVNKLS